jgi:hypothetical protein
MRLTSHGMLRWFWSCHVLLVSETTAVNRTQMLGDITSNTNRTSNTVCGSPQLPNCQQNLQMSRHNDTTCRSNQCNNFFSTLSALQGISSGYINDRTAWFEFWHYDLSGILCHFHIWWAIQQTQKYTRSQDPHPVECDTESLMWTVHDISKNHNASPSGSRIPLKMKALQSLKPGNYLPLKSALHTSNDMLYDIFC